MYFGPREEERSACYSRSGRLTGWCLVARKRPIVRVLGTWFIGRRSAAFLTAVFDDANDGQIPWMLRHSCREVEVNAREEHEIPAYRVAELL